METTTWLADATAPAKPTPASSGPDPETNAEVDAETGTEVESQAETKTKNEVQAEPETKAEVESEDETGSRPEPEAKADAKTKAEDEPESKTEGRTRAEDETGDVPEFTAKAAPSSSRPSGRRRTLTAVMLAAVLLALVASVVTAVLQWQRAGTFADDEDARQEVRTRAAQFGVALLSYDHDNLKDARAKVMSMATDDFAKTYDVAFTGGLEGIIGKLEADATASVRAVYLNDMDAATAKAIVVMDSEVRSTAGTRNVLGSYLEMHLVRQGGQWKVTEVSSIGAIKESMSGGATPSPSPTK